jgi:uncharacterized cupin superfamily protein
MTSIGELHVDSLGNQPFPSDLGSIVVVEWTAPATAEREEIAPRHVHHEDDEIWYVLEGTLGFTFNGEEFEVAAGGSAYARAGVAYTYWNASTSETRYVLVMSRRISDLIATLHDPERRGDRSFAQVFLDHASELTQ